MLNLIYIYCCQFSDGREQRRTVDTYKTVAVQLYCNVGMDADIAETVTNYLSSIYHVIEKLFQNTGSLENDRR